jgi:hypothetical protein
MSETDTWLPLPVPRLSQAVDRLFEELSHRPWRCSRTAEVERVGGWS